MASHDTGNVPFRSVGNSVRFGRTSIGEGINNSYKGYSLLTRQQGSLVDHQETSLTTKWKEVISLCAMRAASEKCICSLQLTDYKEGATQDTRENMSLRETRVTGNILQRQR